MLKRPTLEKQKTKIQLRLRVELKSRQQQNTSRNYLSPPPPRSSEHASKVGDRLGAVRLHIKKSMSKDILSRNMNEGACATYIHPCITTERLVNYAAHRHARSTLAKTITFQTSAVDYSVRKFFAFRTSAIDKSI